MIVANCEDLPATATVIKRPMVYWDVFEQRLLTESAELESIRPLSFRMLRLVAKRSKFYDIEAAVHVSSIADGAGRADVELTTGPNTAFILRSAPREVIVDSLPVETRLEQHGGYCKIFLHETVPGDHLVTLRW
jgi:hypothetical protein